MQFFALAVTLVYGFDAFLLYRDWRQSDIHVTTTTTTTTTSAGGSSAPSDIRVQY